MAAEPRVRGRIDRRLAVVAEKRDSVSFDESAQALGTRLIVDRKPEKRHVADHLADSAFQRQLAIENFARRATAAIIPGITVDGISFDKRCPDDQPEDRSAMLASTGARDSFVLIEPPPECLSALGLEGVGADSNDSRATA